MLQALTDLQHEFAQMELFWDLAISLTEIACYSKGIFLGHVLPTPTYSTLSHPHLTHLVAVNLPEFISIHLMCQIQTSSLAISINKLTLLALLL